MYSVINALPSFLSYIAIPVIIRYLILKKPIQSKWIPIVIIFPIFIGFAVHINSQKEVFLRDLAQRANIEYYPSHVFGSPLLYVAMALSYGILRRKNNEPESEEENSATDEPEAIISSNEIYKTIAEEMERKDYQKGLATRAMAESNGDKELTKSLYIKFRHDELYSQIEGELSKKRADKLRANKLAEKQRQVEQAAKNSTALKWGLGIVGIIAVIGFSLNSTNTPTVVTPPAVTAAPAIVNCKDESTKEQRNAEIYAEAVCHLETLGYKSNRNDCPIVEAHAIARELKLAERGCIESQYSLGLAYSSGTVKDYTQAVFWYLKAAEQGHAGAMESLGYSYEKGDGVIQDKNISEEWYRKSVEVNRKAAEQGNLSAQNDLGRAYEFGRGVIKDEAQAVFWYRKAAEQGNEVAKVALSRLGR